MYPFKSRRVKYLQHKCSSKANTLDATPSFLPVSPAHSVGFPWRRSQLHRYQEVMDYCCHHCCQGSLCYEPSQDRVICRHYKGGVGAGAWMGVATEATPMSAVRGLSYVVSNIQKQCSRVKKTSSVIFFGWTGVIKATYGGNGLNSCGVPVSLITLALLKSKVGAWCVWIEHSVQSMHASLHKWFPLLRHGCLSPLSTIIEMH